MRPSGSMWSYSRLADFIGKSRANASFSLCNLLYIGSRSLNRPHSYEKLVTNSSPKLGC
jgi:hypothetical protein